MRFWSEIKRRKLFQVAATYAVASWLVAQVVTVVSGPLHFPVWFDTAAILLLLFGFPVTLLVTWVWNLTPHGWVLDTGESANSPQRRTIELVLVGILGVALVWVSYREISGVIDAPAPAAASTPVPPAGPRLTDSVAVLPFENLSPNPSNAYFAAGLHDEILNQLAKIGRLNVIARVSVQGYAGSGKTIPEIGAELNVETVMEGTIRYAGNRVRVTTQLIDAARNVHLWSETYERELLDVFAIESDIATNVAAALGAEITAAGADALERRPTESAEAYTLYIEARELYGEDGAGERIEALLRRAIELDRDFALALGYLAERYAIGLGDTSSGDGIDLEQRTARSELVRSYAQRALELDAGVSDAQLALGLLDLLHWRWTSARGRFDAALALGSVRDSSADAAAYLGDFPSAVAIARRLAALNPRDWVAHRNLAQTLLRAGQLDAAAAAVQRALELAPASSAAHRLAAQVAQARGAPDAALRETERAEQLLPSRNRLALAQLALLYGALGRAADARRLSAEVTAGVARERVGAGNWAMALLAVGEEQQALEWLEAAARTAAAHEADASFLNLIQLKTTRSLHPALARPELARVLDRITGD
ncbi:MAG TPA: tetratricopeptide repeat protein [Gammaproteobacteria bacterium]|nr:tetratricopeptide repeat protein [Gammaproteobacteria bacterium]